MAHSVKGTTKMARKPTRITITQKQIDAIRRTNKKIKLASPGTYERIPGTQKYRNVETGDIQNRRPVVNADKGKSREKQAKKSRSEKRVIRFKTAIDYSLSETTQYYYKVTDETQVMRAIQQGFDEKIAARSFYIVIKGKFQNGKPYRRTNVFDKREQTNSQDIMNALKILISKYEALDVTEYQIVLVE